MHSAPSVTYPVVRSRRAAMLLLAAWALGAVPVACWAGLAPAAGVEHLAAAAWVAVSGIVAAWSWRHAPAASLDWDGQHWRCESPGRRLPEGAVALALDLQNLLLVRFLPVGGGVLWLWLDRGAAPASWHALRCAVAARLRPAQAAQTGETAPRGGPAPAEAVLR